MEFFSDRALRRVNQVLDVNQLPIFFYTSSVPRKKLVEQKTDPAKIRLNARILTLEPRDVAVFLRMQVFFVGRGLKLLQISKVTTHMNRGLLCATMEWNWEKIMWASLINDASAGCTVFLKIDDPFHSFESPSFQLRDASVVERRKHVHAEHHVSSVVILGQEPGSMVVLAKDPDGQELPPPASNKDSKNSLPPGSSHLSRSGH